jgi:hypothetical protein
MAGIDTIYTRELHKELGMYAAWTPDSTFRLGDYGELDGRVFKRLGNITDDFNIAIQSEQFDDKEVSHTSEGAVAVKVEAEVDSQGRVNGTAKLNVDFDKSDALFFQAVGVRTQRIKNMKQVGDALIAVYKRRGREWRLNMAVITELRRADNVVALISKKRNVGVGLRGKVKAGKEQNPTTIDLRDLSVTVQNSDVSTFTDNNGATPLFTLHQVRDPLTSKPIFDTQP